MEETNKPIMTGDGYLDFTEEDCFGCNTEDVFGELPTQQDFDEALGNFF